MTLGHTEPAHSVDPLFGWCDDWGMRALVLTVVASLGIGACGGADGSSADADARGATALADGAVLVDDPAAPGGMRARPGALDGGAGDDGGGAAPGTSDDAGSAVDARAPVSMKDALEPEHPAPDEFAGRFKVTPAAYAFPSTKVGGSTSQDFVVTNQASSALVPSVTFSGVDFGYTNSHCSTEVKPLETCRLTVVFAPKSAGMKMGHFTVAATGIRPTDVALSGTGAAQ